jgi:(p)ppGpp synthase/HD superfamily hydrolase
MIDKIEHARLLATFVHFGQRRQDGEDYIDHPKRMVFEYLKTIRNELYPHDDMGETSIDNIMRHLNEQQINVICAIWLHDTIEDAPIEWGMNGFIFQTFGYDIWDIVIILTHDMKLESYNEYITRVFQHPIAWQIKLVDMIDNTSYEIPAKQKTKYKDAVIILMMHGVIVPQILKDRLDLN